MKVEVLKAYCLEKWKAYEEYPFGKIPICYKLNKKIFAQLYPHLEDYKITLKCTPDAGQFYRQAYPGIVVRGYHCPPVQQPFWNTIDINRISESELLRMIDEAYDCLLYSFPKKIQKEIFKVEQMRIRPLRQQEYKVLEDFLFDAIFIPEGCELLPREVIKQPELAVYIEAFGATDDLCLVAEADNSLIGAVWTRILSGKVKGFGNLDKNTPEFAISVKKEFRQQGIGTKLMLAMFEELAKKGYQRASLSVNKENYAAQMYQKLGFQILEEREEDYLMVKNIM